MLKQGFFSPRNPDKYKGNAKQIVYRSGWEARFMAYLDRDSNVILWSSEEIIVPYRDPFDIKKIRRYFVDFYVEYKDGTKLLIEIKPYKQTIPPAKTKGKNGRMLKETMTYLVNKSKWEAAHAFCEKRGWEFKILTEKDKRF